MSKPSERISATMANMLRIKEISPYEPESVGCMFDAILEFLDEHAHVFEPKDAPESPLDEWYGSLNVIGHAGDGTPICTLADPIAYLKTLTASSAPFVSAERDRLVGALEYVEDLRSKYDDLAGDEMPGFGVHPDDSAALLALRSCIDNHGIWPNEKAEHDGDYEACVRHMAGRIAELEPQERSDETEACPECGSGVTKPGLVDYLGPGYRVCECGQEWWTDVQYKAADPQERCGQRRVACAAIKHRVTGETICGPRHVHCFQKLEREDDVTQYAQGFVDQDLNFLSRAEAMVVARDAGQIPAGLPGTGLCSECLYGECDDDVPRDPQERGDDGSRWIKQTRMANHPEGGNCTEAAVASLLGLSLDEVGNFPRGENAEQALAMEEFFNARGFDLIRFDTKPGMKHGYIFDGLYLAYGPTERFGGEVKHMVVMRDGKLHHDPHPDGTGLTHQDAAYIAVPLDPSRLRPVWAEMRGEPDERDARIAELESELELAGQSILDSYEDDIARLHEQVAASERQCDAALAKFRGLREAVEEYGSSHALFPLAVRSLLNRFPDEPSEEGEG